MQRVKTDATTLWIEYWCSQQMININQHGRYHNQKSNLPTLSEENTGDKGGNYKMENEVEVDLNCTQKLFSNFFFINNLQTNYKTTSTENRQI